MAEEFFEVCFTRIVPCGCECCSQLESDSEWFTFESDALNAARRISVGSVRPVTVIDQFRGEIIAAFNDGELVSEE